MEQGCVEGGEKVVSSIDRRKESVSADYDAFPRNSETILIHEPDKYLCKPLVHDKC